MVSSEPKNNGQGSMLPVPVSGAAGPGGDTALVPAGARDLDPVPAAALPTRGLAPAISLNNLIRAARHCWRLALTLGLTLGVGLAAAAWFLLPDRYTSYALLRVASAEPQLLPDKLGGMATVDRYFENTQVALLKSRPIIRAALRRPEISDLSMVRERPDPALWLEEDLKAGFIEKTDIIRVSLTGSSPREVALLVRAVTEAYMEQGVNAQRNQKKAQFDNLEKICLGSEEKIRTQRDVLRRLAEAMKSSDSQALTLKQKMLLDEYATLKRELMLLQAQLRNAEVTIDVQKGEVRPVADTSPNVPEFLIEQALDTSPTVLKKRLELDQLEARIIQAARMYQPGQGALARLESERKGLEEQLAKARTEERAAIRKQLADRLRAEQEARAQQAKENVEVWKRQKGLLEAEAERVDKEAKKLGITSFELEQKRGEIEEAESMIKRIREEKERLQVELQSTNQRVTVLHSAEEPDRKDTAFKVRSTAALGFGGLLFGLFGVALVEARARRIRTREEVAGELGVRVVGTLPALEARSTSVAVPRWWRKPSADPSAVLTASVDAIRSLILADPRRDSCARVLMVTSAMAREGKTSLASHLAMSLARAGQRTLLIDCDLRRPNLHNVYAMEAGPGLAEVLTGKTGVAEAVRSGPAEGLSVLTAGQSPREVGPGTLVRGMPSLLEEFRGRYDFILLDCCPVLPVADALLLANVVDGALLSVRAGQSQAPQLLAACERLSALRIPIVGAVLTGAHDVAQSYGYEYLTEPIA